MEIDHRDRIKNHDWIGNLKESTHQENAANITRDGNLPTGVSFFKRNGKYQAYRYRNNVKIHLGYFDTIIQAAQVREDALKKG